MEPTLASSLLFCLLVLSNGLYSSATCVNPRKEAYVHVYLTHESETAGENNFNAVVYPFVTNGTAEFLFFSETASLSDISDDETDTESTSTEGTSSSSEECYCDEHDVEAMLHSDASDSECFLIPESMMLDSSDSLEYLPMDTNDLFQGLESEECTPSSPETTTETEQMNSLTNEATYPSVQSTSEMAADNSSGDSFDLDSIASHPVIAHCLSEIDKAFSVFVRNKMDGLNSTSSGSPPTPSESTERDNNGENATSTSTTTTTNPETELRDPILFTDDPPTLAELHRCIIQSLMEL